MTSLTRFPSASLACWYHLVLCNIYRFGTDSSTKASHSDSRVSLIVITITAVPSEECILQTNNADAQCLVCDLDKTG